MAALCLLVYLATGQSQAGNDATANVHLVPRLLKHGSLYFTPKDNPKMFGFAVQTPEGKKSARVRDWRMVYEGRPVSEAFDRGVIRVDEPMYYLVPTRHGGKYANTFGLGAGLLALPVVGPAMLVVGVENRLDLLWWLAKLVAALSVAGTVAILFFAAARRVPIRLAAFIALAYGLGTCAFSISSQALWQHGPCEFFLALGAYFLLGQEGKFRDALCGLGLGLAALCRPTSLIVVVCVGGYFLIADRRRLLWFVLGGLPVAAVLIGYAYATFGSPFSFGQLGAGAEVARSKTGQAGLWQTPLFVGLAGLLFSPGRGLFVYTPLSVFAVWGAGRALRDPAWKDLRPLAVAAVALLLLASKWFDWWGGWCFGYRPIVDVAILLAFLSLPVAQAVVESKRLKAAFIGVFAYSVAVQVVGAFAYDVAGWNGRAAWEVPVPGSADRVSFDEQTSADRFVRERGGKVESVVLNIDLPKYRGRLWSWVDSPLVYYVTNFSAARETRKKIIAQFLLDDG